MLDFEEFGEIKEIVREAVKSLDSLEREYNKSIGLSMETRFLSAHSLRVAKIAKFLCDSEGGDCLAVFIAALFHDAGKFIWKISKEFEDVREEVLSSIFAEKILTKLKIDQNLIKKVKKVIEGIYFEGLDRVLEAEIIQDADILDKVGFHGVYTFFSKWSLRGENIFEVVEKRLSGELTYLMNIEKILATNTAKEYAKRLAKRSIEFYKNFLDELAEFGIRYVLKKHSLGDIEILLVVKDKPIDIIFEKIEERIKCRWFEVNITYTDGDSQKIGFCLPKRRLK